MRIMEIKKCSKCGKELPVSLFGKNASQKDGLQIWCKSCVSNYSRNKTKAGSDDKLKKIYTNPDLAKFSPRQLIDELKARGYSGELKYIQTIKL